MRSALCSPSSPSSILFLPGNRMPPSAGSLKCASARSVPLGSLHRTHHADLARITRPSAATRPEGWRTTWLTRRIATICPPIRSWIRWRQAALRWPMSSLCAATWDLNPATILRLYPGLEDMSDQRGDTGRRDPRHQRSTHGNHAAGRSHRVGVPYRECEVSPNADGFHDRTRRFGDSSGARSSDRSDCAPHAPWLGSSAQPSAAAISHARPEGHLRFTLPPENCNPCTSCHIVCQSKCEFQSTCS